jgi:hypothetical protein
MPSPFEARPLFSPQEAADATGLPVRLIRSLMRESRSDSTASAPAVWST